MSLLSKFSNIISKIENIFSILTIASIVLLSALNAMYRVFLGDEIPAAGVYVQNLNLLLTFAGAIIASREGSHLTLSLGHALGDGKIANTLRRISYIITGSISLIVARASFDMAMSERDAPNILPGGIPLWIFQLCMPIGFSWIAIRFFSKKWHIKYWFPTLIICSVFTYSFGFIPADQRELLFFPSVTFFLMASLIGTPIFIIMSGLGLFLFFSGDISISAVPAEVYHIVVSPTLPVVPLFTFAGYLLAKGGASKRLISLFNAWFGWLPGGVAVVAALVCAFFTTFTGASGVTILGLGGFLLPLLISAGYKEKYSIGLLTTAGSLGMLFPPSIPVILYGIRAGIAIDKLFLAGIIPGFFMILVVMLYGMISGKKMNVQRTPFSLKKAIESLWISKYEILLPIILFAGIFSGTLNLGEAASLTAVYILFIECVLTRDISLTKDVPDVMKECATVIGTLLIIFGAALGLTSYMVDAEIPNRLTEWARENIHQKWVFLLVLNAVLLVVGSLMEGLSAIAILVPLIAPVGLAFGINPFHLGIIFLANLEVGFLLPPLGLNLFLSSIRFQKPLSSLYKPIMPFLFLMVLAILVITYIPELSTLLLPLEAKNPPSASFGQ